MFHNPYCSPSSSRMTLRLKRWLMDLCGNLRPPRGKGESPAFRSAPRVEALGGNRRALLAFTGVSLPWDDRASSDLVLADKDRADRDRSSRETRLGRSLVLVVEDMLVLISVGLLRIV